MRVPLLAGLLLRVALAGAALVPGPAVRASVDPETRPIEIEVIRLTNAHRRAHALPLLREDPLLAALARSHSQAMAHGAGPIGHDGLRGRFETVNASLPLSEFAENVARTGPLRGPPASWVVSRWIGSDDHRAHLEGGAFGLVGVGVVRSERGELYFTQIFAAVRRGS